MALAVEQDIVSDIPGLGHPSPQTISFEDVDENKKEEITVSQEGALESKTEEGRGSPIPDQEPCQDGVLDEDSVALGLSNMGRTADGNEVTFLHLTLPGYSLVDINILASYIYLQKLEVPYNKLTDLSVVSFMPYLVELDASHNEITRLLDFSPPHNLQEVDMSFNQIEEMGDLSPHHALTKLVLDKNYISELKGLEACASLQHLSLAHNNIKQIDHLENLSLKYLNLRGNQIEQIKNLTTLKYLQHLDLSGNTISSLQGVEDNRVLEIMDFENNQITDIDEINYIKDLKLLRSLNLLRNPIQDCADYRLSLLFRLPQLAELDRHRAEAEEKVSAVNLFNPPPEVIAAHDHRRCMVYSTLRSAKVYMSTLPSIETPYPILVLSGPHGSGKRILAHRLVEEFGSYFGLGISHTTRSVLPGEMEGKDFNFVSPDDFDSLLKKGDFLLTYQISGHSYGVSLNAIEAVAEQGLACVLPMEVEGVLTLKLAHFQPRYILLLPLDSQSQEERLQAAGGLSHSQISHAVSRTQMYQQIHQDKPGFFDRTIDTSDLEKAYSQLSHLVMTYLGIVSSATGSSEECSGDDRVTSASGTRSEGDRATPGSGTSSQSESGSLSRSPSQRPGASSACSSVKTWSKPSGEHATKHSSSPGLKQREGSSRQMNSVERASYERRKSAAKAAAAGIIPKPLEQLINKPPGTAPGESQFDLGPEKPLRPKTVPSSLPYHDFYSASPDSSEPSIASDSHLSNISEAGGMSPTGSSVSNDSRPASGISFASDKPALPPINTSEQDSDPFNDPEY